MAALAGKLARTDPELDAQIRGVIGDLSQLPRAGRELPEVCAPPPLHTHTHAHAHARRRSSLASSGAPSTLTPETLHPAP